MRHYKLHSSIHLASSISLLLLLSCTQSIVTTSVDNNVLPLGLIVMGLMEKMPVETSDEI